jgi:hypothetical protein
MMVIDSKPGDVVGWFCEHELHVGVHGVSIFGPGLGEPSTENYFILMTKEDVVKKIGCSPLGGPRTMEEIETLRVIESRIK